MGVTYRAGRRAGVALSPSHRACDESNWRTGPGNCLHDARARAAV